MNITRSMVNDTYFYNQGDGNDIIVDNYPVYGSNDKLVFGSGLNASDAVLSSDGYFIKISFAGIPGSVQLNGQASYSEIAIDEITFGDGAVWTAAELASQLMLQQGSSASEWVYGTIYADLINAGAGDDVVIAGLGDDTINPGDGNDTLYGFWGHDKFVGSGGNDYYYGEGDYDTVDYSSATSGVVVNFSASTITLSGYTLDAYSAADGVGGIDRFSDTEAFIGSSYGDFFYGIATADDIRGGNGNDWIFGADGNDLLSGDEGNDIIIGGSGDDTLTGGAGSDTFVFSDLSGADTVTDFVNGEDCFDLRSFGASFSNISVTTVGADVRIGLASGPAESLDVLIKNVTASSIDSSDFLFA